MLTISKPLSAGHLRQYHQEEFANGRANYYTAGDRIQGEWHGRLAARWGLSGDVDEAQFGRLAEGQHPTTGVQLVQHQTPRTYSNAEGESVTTLEHRAGWDATFSAPKSVSLTALVGDDDRVREAHRESVTVALDDLERYVQARIGRNHPAETTGQWVAARFEHDSARPVDGYAAPQLHTHVVVFNVTETGEGDTRALQPRELYRTQRYATAVYRSELATRLQTLGYEIERGPFGQLEIAGYTQAYLDASSPRHQQIQEHLAQQGHGGSEAAEIAAHHTREAKLESSHDEMQRRHQEIAHAFGDQPAHVVAVAEAHAQQRQLQPDVQAVAEGRAQQVVYSDGLAQAHERDLRPDALAADTGVTFAKERNFEREAVVDQRDLLRDALRRSLGEAPVEAVKAEFERSVGAGELLAVNQNPGAPGRAFTTPEMIELEQHTIQAMRHGQGQHDRLAAELTVHDVASQHPKLSDRQLNAVEHIAASRDQVMALEGVAGAGKTTTLAAVRDAAEREGYVVEGLAPTSRAAQQLATAGIDSGTLQRHLARTEAEPDERRHLYVLDESSLASTRQMHAFFERLAAQDRVLLVGDVRQHQAVEAGRPYQQLQEAGLDIARLDDIVRQQDPALKTVVEHLSRGEVRQAVHQLDSQGRVLEVADRAERLHAIGQEYLKDPERTLVVSPDNRSRVEINEVIHHARQAIGQVSREEHHAHVLVPRQDVTGADRRWAEQYHPGDVVRYTSGSRVLGLPAGEYATVQDVDARTNRLTVARDTGAEVTYDPRRLKGVTIYREAERAFAVGDRVQVTAPDRERRVANRELGTVEAVDDDRQLHLRLDSGRSVAYALESRLHLDHGYAVTSHSSQGLTADRVLLHVDTERAGEALVNQRLAYVAISRGRHDAQIYTNDKTQLPAALGRDISHRSALDQAPEQAQTPPTPAQALQPAATPRRSIGHGISR
jgi:conjugative relaxase-like TrwC/TraI family protein